MLFLTSIELRSLTFHLPTLVSKLSSPPFVLISDKETLVLAWVVSGGVLAIIQLILWMQINDRLPPKQQIGWQALKDTFLWFREDGLLARMRVFIPSVA